MGRTWDPDFLCFHNWFCYVLDIEFEFVYVLLSALTDRNTNFEQYWKLFGIWHLCLTVKFVLVQILIHPGIDLFLSKSLGRWIWLTLKIWPSVREVVWWPTNDVSCRTGHTGSRGKVNETEIKGNSRSVFKSFYKWCIHFDLFC